VITLLATIIPLGIAASIKPALLAMQLITVSSPQWWPRARALALGAAIPVAGYILIGLLGFSQVPPPKPNQIDVLGLSLRTVIGIGFLIASVWLLRPHAALQRKVADYVHAKLQTARVRDFFVLGLIGNAKSITLFALLIPAVHDIAVAQVPDITKGLTVSLLFVLVLTTVLAPIAARAVLGSRFDFQKASNVVLANNFRILGFTALFIGLYLTGSAAAIVALFERL
jgi:hypothetical protein